TVASTRPGPGDGVPHPLRRHRRRRGHDPGGAGAGTWVIPGSTSATAALLLRLADRLVSARSGTAVPSCSNSVGTCWWLTSSPKDSDAELNRLTITPITTRKLNPTMYGRRST